MRFEFKLQLGVALERSWMVPRTSLQCNPKLKLELKPHSALLQIGARFFTTLVTPANFTAMAEPQTSVYLERHGSIATIIINRPEQRNAINVEMWLELKRLAGEIDKVDETRVVIIRGAGDEAFSAGADISEFDSLRNNSKQGRAYSESFDGALDAVWGINKPVISMIRGFCVGGGLELACCTDLRIAAEGSRFGIPTARLGVLVGYREMRRLLQLVGRGRRGGDSARVTDHEWRASTSHGTHHAAGSC